MTRKLLRGLLYITLVVGVLNTLETKLGNKIRDRNNLPPQLGHPYAGVVSAAAGICFVHAPWMTMPHAPLVVPFWVLQVVSTPAALAVETLMLPVDLSVHTKAQRTTFSQYCAYYAQQGHR